MATGFADSTNVGKVDEASLERGEVLVQNRLMAQRGAYLVAACIGLAACPSSCEDRRRADPGPPSARPAASEPAGEASPGHGPDRDADGAFVTERREMVSTQMRDVTDPKVLRAMRRVPRHRFVPESLWHAAYADRPLPIGHDQTISQPYIVALMTQLADVGPGDNVLEVGTGSGYQAAVLAEMGADVYTIEIVEPLAETARQRLAGLGYERVRVRHGDGYRGWPDHAPFDAVVVTAAPPEIPEPLQDQLAVGGRLVVPVGDRHQELLVLTRTEEGFARRSVVPVRFVPMTGEAQDRAP